MIWWIGCSKFVVPTRYESARLENSLSMIKMRFYSLTDTTGLIYSVLYRQNLKRSLLSCIDDFLVEEVWLALLRLMLFICDGLFSHFRAINFLFYDSVEKVTSRCLSPFTLFEITFSFRFYKSLYLYTLSDGNCTFICLICQILLVLSW